MKLLLTLLLLLAAISPIHASECLPTKQAARAAHPTGHISWSGGCYFAGYPHSHRKGKEVMQTEQSQRRYRETESRPRQAFPPPGAESRMKYAFTWYDQILCGMPTPYYRISQAFADYEREWR
jgi:hypothetical protein